MWLCRHRVSVPLCQLHDQGVDGVPGVSAGTGWGLACARKVVLRLVGTMASTSEVS